MAEDKNGYIFSLERGFKQHLEEGIIGKDFEKAFKNNDQQLSNKAKITKIDEKYWVIEDSLKRYKLKDTGEKIKVFLELFFSVDAGIKSIVGKDLITDDITAVFELVKNSFDAGANKVSLSFLDIFSSTPSLLIEDDGCGMSLDDIEKKWMCVGHSEKHIIKSVGNRTMAGSKGIGRFSCDRLGEKLIMQTKTEKDKNVHTADFNWLDFDSDEKIMFSNIPIKYYPSDEFEYNVKIHKKNNSGTTLFIQNLRSKWDKDKIKILNDNLSRFINPLRNDFENFSIFIFAPDIYTKELRIKNELFEEMESYIVKSSVKKNGGVEQIIIDNQELVSHNKYSNPRYSLIPNINLIIYYLPIHAKARFSKKMGITFKDYGSIFLYRNGFRIRPYGERANDWLAIDVRKSQHTGDRLGNRDIVGYLDIAVTQDSKLNDDVSSRQGLDEDSDEFKLIKNFVFEQFLNLETYWNKMKKLKKGDEILEKEVFLNIKEYAKNIEDKEIREYILENIETMKELSKKKDETIKAEKVKNEFLLASSQSKQAYKNCVHTMNLYSKNIQDANKRVIKYIMELPEKISKNRMFKPSKNLMRSLKNIQEDAKRINTVARLSKAADFNMRTKTIKGNIIKYIQEYFDSLSSSRRINIQYELESSSFETTFSPVDISILVENFVDNSYKKGAETIKFIIWTEDTKLILEIKDDGKSIDEDIAGYIFDLGFSTTGGSGIGLYHVKEIIEKMNSTIKYVGKGIGQKGAKFEIVIKGDLNET